MPAPPASEYQIKHNAENEGRYRRIVEHPVTFPQSARYHDATGSVARRVSHQSIPSLLAAHQSPQVSRRLNGTRSLGDNDCPLSESQIGFDVPATSDWSFMKPVVQERFFSAGL
ncbi:hypothetical protein ACFFJ7_17615 [Pseudochelatococcus lubricantis]|uniref:hypothetical protein n=1 Tax=Pseudochelatococcus lubricantis TaxID=1538102 RepID=UPI0035E7D4EE